MSDKKKTPENSRRKFFEKLSIITGGAVLAGAGLGSSMLEDLHAASGKKIKLLSPTGKLVEVDEAKIDSGSEHTGAHCAHGAGGREAIPGKKFVMVIDLSRCKRALKCQEACHKHHYTMEGQEYLKIYKMQDSPEAAPYWMPKPCMQCENPPCVKVCPVGATFKSEDGIVSINNETCVGCRFCMAACPYSTRVFNWKEPVIPEDVKNQPYSIEKSLPKKKGTVDKCDFCPDMIRQGKLPHCVSACPNGVFFFGDRYEDTVTNGSETFRFSELIRDKAGYRYMEDLGTEPNVWYLPEVNRLFPFEEPEEDKDNSKNHEE